MSLVKVWFLALYRVVAVLSACCIQACFNVATNDDLASDTQVGAFKLALLLAAVALVMAAGWPFVSGGDKPE